MTCEACERAGHNPRTGIYYAACQNCEARSLAQSPEANQRERDPSAIQTAMRRTWPVEAEYRKGRALVWAWINRFEQLQAQPVAACLHRDGEAG